MGLWGKLLRKKEEPDLDTTFSDNKIPAFKEESLSDNLGLEEKPVLPDNLTEPSARFSSPSPDFLSRASTLQRDLELINSKLDTIKALLSSLDQRVANLEKNNGTEQKKMPW